MNWWFTPISFILTLVIYIAPPIILRFAIFRKPIEHKKARNFSLIYGAVFLIILAFVSKEMAILQALFIIPWFGFINYFLLAGFKENPHGQILLYHLILFFSVLTIDRILSIVFSFTLDKQDTIQAFNLIFRIPLMIFAIYKYKRIKSDVLEKFRQKELYKTPKNNDPEIM